MIGHDFKPVYKKYKFEINNGSQTVTIKHTSESKARYHIKYYYNTEDMKLISVDSKED